MVTMRRLVWVALVLGLALVSGQALAGVTLTGLTTTNNQADGVGDVTITFTTDEANFGAAPSGGWYVRVALPSTMALPSAYSTFSTCSSSTIDISEITSPKVCGTIITPTTVVVSNTNPGISQMVGAGSYTMVINDVTNPSEAGSVSLTEVSVYDANSGQVIASASSGNLAEYSLEISGASKSIPVPTLGWYAMVLLMLAIAGLGMAGLRRAS